jgi:molybdopterin-guanine dinucleotide biosynthesis protein A
MTESAGRPEKDAPPLSAIILAGGRSRRFGTDKALIPWRGRPLIETVLEAVSQVTSESIVVTNSPQPLRELSARLVPDELPGTGSLVGIHSGLKAARHDHSLVVACDMPLLNLELLTHMAAQPRDYDVLIPRTAEGVEPLHAIYGRACIDPIARVLHDGGRRIIQFFPQVRVRYLEQKQVDRFDPHHLSFFNINTPQDLQKALDLSPWGCS